MHEFSMSEKAFEIIMERARKENMEKITKIHLAIGDLTLLNHDQIRFWIRELSGGTIAEGCNIEIERRDSTIRCNSCGFEGKLQVKDDPIYHVFNPSFTCPECDSADIEIVSGLEFEVVKMEGIKKNKLKSHQS